MNGNQSKQQKLPPQQQHPTSDFLSSYAFDCQVFGKNSLFHHVN